MKKTLATAFVALITLGVFASADAEARGRTGSHRVGGHGSHGKGSHYVGGHR
ncbi:hypothetical protein MKK64_21850 [Methylobacterium sp. E-025]|uniref:hypothetical protein n=1 Tax=unclassified Methylobacterium TaxID=2615210 RepID=UPI001FBA029A|nr:MULTISPECIES: hypothetical protein [unclassified Methylobacterium]MCJ2039080.1 hypothetical protein [Methylobacterium sp. J-059]MCJ2113815.1 hypothetical protein [Methylobacterium sp. E-025]